MKNQHISVDMMNMVWTACSYLALAGAIWIFLRLIQACLLLPNQMKRRNKLEGMLQEKVDSYEKYVLECEEKERMEMLDQIDDEKKNLEMSEKWKERRECLDMLKHELKRVQNNDNDTTYWDKLMDEELKKYADSNKISEEGEENSENDANKEENVNSEEKKELVDLLDELKKDK